MGEIVVKIELENFVDRALQEEGRVQEAHVRRHSMDAVADTGAVMLALPQDVVEKLGLRSRRKVVVSYADDRRDERAVAGAVTIKIGDRAMTTECIVGPPLSEALIGQVVMEELAHRRSATPDPHAASRIPNLSVAETQTKRTTKGHTIVSVPSTRFTAR